MTTQETADLRALEDDALRGELEEARQALFNLRFQGATRQLADVSQPHKMKRRIARIATLLRERELIADYDASAGSGASDAATAVAAAPAAGAAEGSEAEDNTDAVAVDIADTSDEERNTDTATDGADNEDGVDAAERDSSEDGE